MVALSLHILGIITWSFVCYVVMLIMREVARNRERRMRRINIVNQMQTIPYANLAFNVDHTCAICFEHFKNDEEVV